VRSLSLQRAKSIVRRCQDSTADVIWITIFTDVPTRGFLTPPPLTSVGARGSSENAPVVDLSSSSDEGDLIVDVLRDEEYTRRFFGDINRDVLGPPDDDKIIILNDSDEQEEVCEKKAADTEAMPSSAARSSAPTVSTVDADGTYKSNTPDRATGGCSSSGDEAGLP
jgi:hypothetical protein